MPAIEDSKQNISVEIFVKFIATTHANDYPGPVDS